MFVIGYYTFQPDYRVEWVPAVYKLLVTELSNFLVEAPGILVTIVVFNCKVETLAIIQTFQWTEM